MRSSKHFDPVLLFTVFLSFIISHISVVNSTLFEVDLMNRIELTCSVANYQLNVVSSRWSKKQGNDLEAVVLFVDDKPQMKKIGDFARYHATRTAQSQGFIIHLFINDTQGQDSGQYICESLDGDGNTVFKSDHILNVIVPAQSVILFKNYTDGNMTDTAPLFPFRYSSARNGSIGCMVIGGNPQPNITVLIGDSRVIPQKLIHAKLMWSNNSSSVAGFQKPSWHVVTNNDGFNVQPEYDGKIATCMAIVHSYNLSSYISLLVDAIPFFHANSCNPEQYASLSTKKAQLSCRFHSHPAGEVNWTRSKTNKPKSYNSISDYDGLENVVLLDGDNDFIAKLVFPQVTADSYQAYTLTVSNDLGYNKTTIQFSPNGQANFGNCFATLLATVILAQLIKTLNTGRV